MMNFEQSRWICLQILYRVSWLVQVILCLWRLIFSFLKIQRGIMRLLAGSLKSSKQHLKVAFRKIFFFGCDSSSFGGVGGWWIEAWEPSLLVGVSLNWYWYTFLYPEPRLFFLHLRLSKFACLIIYYILESPFHLTCVFFQWYRLRINKQHCGGSELVNWCQHLPMTANCVLMLKLTAKHVEQVMGIPKRTETTNFSDRDS